MVSNKNPFSLGSVGMCKELKAYFCVWQEKGFVQQIATAFEFWDLFPSFQLSSFHIQWVRTKLWLDGVYENVSSIFRCLNDFHKINCLNIPTFFEKLFSDMFPKHFSCVRLFFNTVKVYVKCKVNRFRLLASESFHLSSITKSSHWNDGTIRSVHVLLAGRKFHLSIMYDYSFIHSV